MEKLFTAKDLVGLGISRERAYQLMHSRAFPSMKIGGRYYISEKGWNQWVQQYQYKEYLL